MRKEPYPLNKELIAKINSNLDLFEKRYVEVVDKMFDMPSVLARFERIGIVTEQQSRMIGVVGMAARSAGINRDIRSSHGYAWYPNIDHHPILLESGDVKARAKLRDMEICQSLNYIRQMLARYETNASQGTEFLPPKVLLIVSLFL
jgi:Ni,Fe-hydrogenase III large subunit